MIFFKSCPRCEGDRALERDSYGWYIICLICGHVSYPAEAQVLELSTNRGRGYSPPPQHPTEHPSPGQAL